ncbi:ClpP/crotonase [Martensiomyces pterosporus]|nr:ClpP/crotonase [Martensiomyces pterosporus]
MKLAQVNGLLRACETAASALAQTQQEQAAAVCQEGGGCWFINQQARFLASLITLPPFLLSVEFACALPFCICLSTPAFDMSLIDLPLVELTNPDPSFPALFVLRLNNGAENRFTIQFVSEIMQALDFIDAKLDSLSDEDAPRGGALVTTSQGKFYSNGLAIEAAMRDGDKFYIPYLNMLARLLTFRLPTVAAINGHAFAGGCMFAMAHDYRIMRADRGWIAMNEVDLGIPLIPGMAAIVKCKMNQPNYLRDCVIGGHRFKSSDAVAGGFVDRAVKDEELLPTALQYAKALAPKAQGGGQNLHLLKAEIYRDTVAVLLAGGTVPGGYLAKL